MPRGLHRLDESRLNRTTEPSAIEQPTRTTYRMPRIPTPRAHASLQAHARPHSLAASAAGNIARVLHVCTGGSRLKGTSRTQSQAMAQAAVAVAVASATLHAPAACRRARCARPRERAELDALTRATRRTPHPKPDRARVMCVSHGRRLRAASSARGLLRQQLAGGSYSALRCSGRGRGAGGGVRKTPGHARALALFRRSSDDDRGVDKRVRSLPQSTTTCMTHRPDPVRCRRVTGGSRRRRTSAGGWRRLCRSSR